MPKFDESSNDFSDMLPPRDFAEEPSYLASRSIKRDLLNQQRDAWERGEPVPPEEILARWPTNPQDDPFSVAVLYEDMLRHQARGDDVSIAAYSAKFPAQGEKLQSFVNQHMALRSFSGSSRAHEAMLGLPDTGDEVFGFRLRGELGRGAFARVFLAEQEELAGRAVVVKLSAIEGSEPQTLAQLQHTNIVPIYSVHEDAQAGLRAVCMPFFAGASLSQVMRELWKNTSSPQSGRELVEALDRAQAPALAASARTTQPSEPSAARVGSVKTPRAHLAEMTFHQAVAWLVARIADGLEHAHNRGVLHRDVKPANVLLAGDGQPLLLDFNLAQDQLGDVMEATLGGTVSYMSPEHLRAVIGRTPDLVKQVNERSDIYSLGMVLHELLAGHSPFDQSASYSAVPLQIEAMALERGKATPSLRAERPDVSWTLESILRKCLAPQPEDRYQRAEQVAEDLRCFIENRPLRHAPELSWVECVEKWLRRHPRMAQGVAIASLAAVVIFGISTALSVTWQHLTQTQSALASVQARDRQQAFEDGTLKALCLVNTVVPMQDHTQQGQAVCEQTLGLYGLLNGTEWNEPADWQTLPASERDRLAEDARELLMLLAAARVQQAPQDAATLRGAVSLLQQAAAIPRLRPSRALCLELARYHAQIGDGVSAELATIQAEVLPMSTARDHYLAATAYARSGGRAGFEKAIRALDEAIKLEPRHYWSWVQRGFCHYELGDQFMAIADFGHCTGLWPDFAWGYFNRARVLSECGRHAAAIDDYSAALDRDPLFVAAYVNRGLARLEQQQHQAALDDFDSAVRLAQPDDSLLASRGIALEALGRHADADAAFTPVLSRLQGLAPSVRQRVLWAYGFAVSTRLPGAAESAFDDVLTENPRNAQAWYGRAMLAMQDSHLVPALDAFDRTLDIDAEFLVARRYRAICQARLGHFDRASEDINHCLRQDPTGASSLYAAACVAALAADQSRNPEVAQQSLDFLERAIAQGVDPEKARSDPDLAGVIQHVPARSQAPPGNVLPRGSASHR